MKKMRLGIVGTENSHADRACAFFNNQQAIEGVSVEILLPGDGDTIEHAEKIRQTGKIHILAGSPEDMLGQADLVIIMNRHAKYHAKYATFFLEKQIPVFVDKPLTCCLEEAEKIINLSHNKNVWFSSWSPIWHASSFKNFLAEMPLELDPFVSGMVVGRADFTSEYGGLFFYGIHSVELMLQCFGFDIESVDARLYGKDCFVTITMGNKTVISLHLFGSAPIPFQLLVHGQKNSRYLQIDTSDKTQNSFTDLINSVRNNEIPLTGEQLLMPVKILLAINKSINTGRTIKIN